MAVPTSIELQIVTPDRAIVKEQVDEVEIPGADGYFGVLPGHTPMLAALSVGELWYRKGQERTYLAIAEGRDRGGARRGRAGARLEAARRSGGHGFPACPDGIDEVDDATPGLVAHRLRRRAAAEAHPGRVLSRA